MPFCIRGSNYAIEVFLAFEIGNYEIALKVSFDCLINSPQQRTNMEQFYLHNLVEWKMRKKSCNFNSFNSLFRLNSSNWAISLQFYGDLFVFRVPLRWWNFQKANLAHFNDTKRPRLCNKKENYLLLCQQFASICCLEKSKFRQLEASSLAQKQQPFNHLHDFLRGYSDTK